MVAARRAAGIDAGMIVSVSALDLAHALIAGAVANGVREIVVCPGSRSAPLAYAAYAAEQAGLVRLHVRVDERSAGFLALGLAKTTRVPAAIITTSGTAVANLHPAVLEAHHAKVALLVLSADRPAALRGSGANQTTIQPGIFAGAVRWEADLDDTADAAATMAIAWRAATGTTADPGPVHLNVCLAEPLVPAQWPGHSGFPFRDRDVVRDPALHTLASTPLRSLEATRPVPAADKTLVLLGDLIDPRRRPEVLSWAARRGHPVIAEPFGEHADHALTLPHGPLVLTDSDVVDAHAPEVILTVGRLTLSRPVSALLRRPGVRIEALTDTADVPDPAKVVTRAHDLSAVLAAPQPDPQPASAWAQAWLAAGQRVAAAVAAHPPPWPSGLAVAQTMAAALPPRAILFTGPSNPVRDLDLGVCRFPAGVSVLASRGLAGIDGCIATAVGIALADAGRPAYAVMGDLTFLHDANALLIGPHEPRPDLTILVINDDGGGIFGLLEPGGEALAEPYERLFGTPTRTDLGALAGAHGIPHERVESPEQLAAAMAQPPRGLRVVEVRTDRAGHRRAHAHLRAIARAALRE